MYKCGITGHSGVLGREAINNINFKYNFFKGDIRNKKDVYKWIIDNNFDLILHFAAVVPVNLVEKDYSYAYDVNFNGTKNIINSILESKIKLKWFFYSSTSHVYSYSKNFQKIRENFKKKPSNKYGKTKLKAENYIRKKTRYIKIPFCIGRIYSFTHPNQEKLYLIPSLTNKIKKNKKNIITLKNLNHYRDFVSTDDICKAIKKLWQQRARGEFNIASGNKVYLEKIASFICQKYRKKAKFINARKTSFLVANIEKIKKIGWKPKNKINYILKNYLKNK